VPSDLDAQALLEAEDNALYQATRNGRDRIVCATAA
jgi:PleD family two-component response regulator